MLRCGFIANLLLVVSSFAKQFNDYDPRPETVEYLWRRLLKSTNIELNKTSLSKPFILAILYMLHLERFSSERPKDENNTIGQIRRERRELLKRYDV